MATDATILAVGVEAKGVQQATTDLRNLSEQAKKTEASTKSLGSSLGQQQSALAKTEQENNKLIESWAREVTMLGKTKSEMLALEGQHRGFNSAQMESVKVLQSKIKAFEDSSKAAKEAAAAQKKAAQEAVAAQEAAAAATAKNTAMLKTYAAVAVGALALGFKAVFESGVQAEKMQNALTAITGSSATAAKEMSYVRDVANKLGLELVSTSSAYTKLMASAKGTVLEGDKTRKVFEAVSGAAAKLGLSVAETDGALLAISQMMSKGVVSAEELRGQLGERLPGAFGAMAAGLGKTTAELSKMLEQGEVGIDALNKFADQLNKQYGGSGPVQTAQASLNRLGNAWEELKQSIAKSGVVDAAVAVMNGMAFAIAKATNVFDAYYKAGAGSAASFIRGFLSIDPGVMVQAAKATADAVAAEYRRASEAQRTGAGKITVMGAGVVPAGATQAASEYDKVIAKLNEKTVTFQKNLQVLYAEFQRQGGAMNSENLQRYRSEVDRLVKASDLAAPATKKLGDAAGEAGRKYDDYGESMERFNAQRKGEEAASKELFRNLAEIQAIIDKSGDSFNSYTNKIDDTTKSYQKQIDAMEMNEDALLRRTAAQLEAQLVQQRAAEGENAVTAALQGQLDVLNKLINARENKEAVDTAAKTAKEAEDAWKRTADSIENSLTDALMRGFEGGKDWAKNFLDTLKNMFGSLVLRPIIQAVLAPVAGGAASLFSGGASASSGGGLGGMFSNVSNLGSLFGGSSSIGSSLAGGISGLFGPSSFTAGLAGDAFMPAMIGQAGASMAGLGSALSAAIPVIGTALAIGTMIYSFVKANKDPAQVKGQFQVGGTNFEDSAFVKSRFGDLGFADAGTQQFSGDAAKSFSKIVADLLEAAADQMDAGQIARVAEKLNATIFEGLEGTFTTQDFLSKYGADILQQTMSVAFDEINPKLAELMRAFEGSAEEMGAYAEKLIQVQAFVGQAADAYGGIYANLSADDVLALSDAFGGLGNVMSATEGYMAALYSDTERLALTSDALQRQFEKLGVAMPESKDAFRSLVEGLDLTTEQGRSLYTELLRVAPAFVAVSDAATESAAAMQRAAEALRGDMAAFDAMQTSRPADKATISRNALIDQYLAGDAARGADFQKAYGSDYGAYASAVGGMQREEFGKFEDADRDAILQIIKAQQELTTAYTKATSVIDSAVEPTRDFYSAVDDGTTAAVAVAKAQDWSNEIAQKSIELLQAQGKEIEALNAQRAIELASLKDAPAELLTLVNTLYDLRVESVNVADAARAVAEAEKAAAAAAEDAAKAKQRLVDATEDEIAAYKETIDAFLVPLGDLDAAMREIEPTAKALVEAWASNKREMTELADAIAELDGTRAKTGLEALGETMAAIERIGNVRTNIADNLLDLMAGKVDPASVKVLKDREAALAETLQTAPDKEEIAAKLTQITLRRIQLEGAIEQKALDARWKSEQKVLQEQIDLTNEARDVEIDALRERISGAERLRDIAAGMGKYLSSLRAGPLSPLGYTERLGEAKGLFEKTIGDALAGNIDALGDLQGRAQDYLGQAQAYFGGATGGYADVFKVVTDALEKFGLDAATASNSDALQAQLAALESIQFVLEESAADQVDTTDAQIAALQALDVSFAGIEDGLRESAQDQTAALREQLAELRTVVVNQEAQIKQAAAAYTAMLAELQGMNTKLDGIKADGALAEAAA